VNYFDKFVKIKTMRTVELDLEKDQKLDSLSHFIKSKKIKVGEEEFVLKIHSYHEVSQMLYAGFLLLLAKYFIIEKSKDVRQSKQDLDFIDKQGKTYYELYFKSYDVDKLENRIEKDFNVDIELERKKPLDDVFGIWKNENITIGKIREKAWQRAK